MIESSLISGDKQTALRFTGYQGAKLGVLLSLIQEQNHRQALRKKKSSTRFGGMKNYSYLCSEIRQQ